MKKQEVLDQACAKLTGIASEEAITPTYNDRIEDEATNKLFTIVMLQKNG